MPFVPRNQSVTLEIGGQRLPVVAWQLHEQREERVDPGTFDAEAIPMPLLFRREVEVHLDTSSPALAEAIQNGDYTALTCANGDRIDGLVMTGLETNYCPIRARWNVVAKLAYAGAEQVGHQYPFDRDNIIDGRGVDQPIGVLKRLSPEHRLSQIIASRMAPAFIGRQRRTNLRFDEREKRARETLRRIIGEYKYRRYLRDGFVTVQGASGRVYCIYPGHEFTRVYFGNQFVEQLCVVFQGQFPPTDSLIMRYLMLSNDELGFRAKANKWRADQRLSPPVHRPKVDQRPLTVILGELKPKEPPPQSQSRPQFKLDPSLRAAWGREGGGFLTEPRATLNVAST